jgi:hypothetical protein
MSITTINSRRKGEEREIKERHHAHQMGVSSAERERGRRRGKVNHVSHATTANTGVTLRRTLPHTDQTETRRIEK